MSEGPAIPLAFADQVAAYLAEAWPGVAVVGSVRRRRTFVHDLEFIAPALLVPDLGKCRPDQDRLFLAIDDRMETKWVDEKNTLFAPPTQRDYPPLGRALRGLKPGFLACSIELRPRGPSGVELPLACQVYRYTPRNRGWLEIERTGPREFGIQFLHQWKKSFRIPVANGSFRASIANHLVDALGNVVPVESEAEAFRLAGMPLVPPQRRDEYVDRLSIQREHLA